jgi:hypothetical protein
MADATADPDPISTPRKLAPIQPTPAPVPTPAPIVVPTPQAVASTAPMTIAQPASLPRTSIPGVDLDPDVDQAIIYELRDKTMTEVFTLRQDNAKATSAYTWTMRSHAFE